MEIKTIIRYQRIAPRKLRLVADLIREKNIFDAKKELDFCKKRGASIMSKVLDTAIANAKNNFQVPDDKMGNIYIKEIRIDEGPKLKRWRPVSRGAAHEIQKKTSHITLILGEKEEKKNSKSKKSKKDNFNKKEK